MSSDPPPSPLQIPTALLRGLADAAATTEQIRSALAASASLPSDIQFAAERVGDIARALRGRDVETALCDSLESAARDIGDAVVSQHAATGRTSSAAQLLEHLSQVMNNMIALAGAVELEGGGLADAPSPSAAGSLTDAACEAAPDETSRRPCIERLDDTAQKAAASAVAALPPHEVRSSARQNDEQLAGQVPQTLPEMKADASAGENADDAPEPLLLPIPSPLKGEKKNNSSPVLASRRQLDDVNVAARSATHDLFAPLRALSEEELIALFG